MRNENCFLTTNFITLEKERKKTASTVAFNTTFNPSTTIKKRNGDKGSS